MNGKVVFTEDFREFELQYYLGDQPSAPTCAQCQPTCAGLPHGDTPECIECIFQYCWPDWSHFIIGRNLTIEAVGGEVVLDAGTANQSISALKRVFFINPPGAASISVNLVGLTIRNGRAYCHPESQAPALGIGGGTCVEYYAARVYESTGGGIFALGPASLVMSDCAVQGCSAVGGAGMYIEGCEVIMTACNLTSNYIPPNVGGAVTYYNAGGGVQIAASVVTMIGCTIADNRAGYRGAGKACLVPNSLIPCPRSLA
jgi:hypothetical protein